MSSAIGSMRPRPWSTTVAPVAATSRNRSGSTSPERPDGGPDARHADGSVPVLHGRIRLGPRAARLPHLQRGLVRQTDGPSPSQEHVVVERADVDREVGGEGAFAVLCDRLEVLAEPGAQQRERPRREPRLDDRAFVREAEDDPAVGGVRDRRVVDAADRHAIARPPRDVRAAASPRSSFRSARSPAPRRRYVHRAPRRRRTRRSRPRPPARGGPRRPARRTARCRTPPRRRDRRTGGAGPLRSRTSAAARRHVSGWLVSSRSISLIRPDVMP